MKYKRTVLTATALTLLLGTVLAYSGGVVDAASGARPIAFPVIGPVSYSNDYEAPRSNGPHHAIDVIAKKGQRLVAAADGVITFVAYPQPSWGYAIFMKDNAGYSYNYLHINNDNPGTDDGAGGPMHAYAPDVRAGNRVVKGQLLGWVGDSGNAENTVSHLHFEMEDPQGNKVNPYLSLQGGQHLNNNIAHPPLFREILPYGNQAKVRVNIDMGNADADQTDEVVSGVGPGGTTPQVKLYDDNRVLMSQFNAYHNPNYKGGADVAMGDIDGDGVDEIITGAGTGGGPSVKAFETNGTEIANFLAYEDQIRSGLSITAGDVDNDGTDEIITGLRTGSQSTVKIFKRASSDGAITLFASYFAYLPSFVGGIDVASADVTGNGADEVITVPIANGGPDVRVYNASGTQLNQFFAYDTSYRRGSRISAGNVFTGSAKSEIATVPVDATADVRVFNNSGSLLEQHHFLEQWWRTTYDIGAGFNDLKGSTGVNRRTSIRPALD